MEWVETTGRTVEEAMESALDELGVDEVDAEFEVLAQPQTGLFGRLRGEARVRARVRPTAPRAKDDRRDRRDRRRRTGSSEAAGGDGSTSGDSATAGVDPGPEKLDDKQPDPGAEKDPATGDRDARPEGTGTRRRGRSAGRARNAKPVGTTESAAGPSGSNGDAAAKGAEVEVALERQAEIAVDFLEKLTAAFGLNATVAVARPDDETVEVRLSGSDLGILIGPKGATLLAVQNLTRTVVFNETGANNGHINVDVGGYRQKRTDALIRFATQVATSVKQSGTRTAMEPMSSLDRKVVHDAISEIEGVSTISEGEEPRRRVVVIPD